MKYLFACLVTLSATFSFAQTASFSSLDGRLEIPYLTVNQGKAYKDVELMLDASGTVFELVDFRQRAAEWSQSRNITLSVGEAQVIDENFTVTFRGMLTDSRCPSDVTCIIAGEGVAIFALDESLASGRTRKTIFGLPFTGLDPGSLSDRSAPAHEFRGIYFSPLTLEPYPVSTEVIAEEDYVVTFQVTAVAPPCEKSGDCWWE